MPDQIWLLRAWTDCLWSPTAAMPTLWPGRRARAIHEPIGTVLSTLPAVTARTSRRPIDLGAMSSRSLPTVHQWLRLARQFIRFGLVGGSGVIVNVVVAVLMNRANGGAQNAQNVIFPIPGTDFNVRFTALVWIGGFLVANLYNYQLNRSWTFRGVRHRGWWSGFGRFLAIGAAAAVIGLMIKIALTNPSSLVYLGGSWFDDYDASAERTLVQQLIGMFNSREYMAQFIAILVTMPINFIVNKLWTFRAKKPTPAPEPTDAGG